MKVGMSAASSSLLLLAGRLAATTRPILAGAFITTPRYSGHIVRRSTSSSSSSSSFSTKSHMMKNVEDDTKLVQDMLYRIDQINNIPQDVYSSLLDFVVDGITLGKVTPSRAKLLSETDAGQGPVFAIQDGKVALTAVAGDTSESRTLAVEKVMEKLRDDGVVTGWRDELYPVAESFYSEPIFLMERAAVALLGIREYGVHVNGLVQSSPTEAPKMWLGRRSPTKSKYPGMLDHIAAGGQPAGIGLLDNVVKECFEEAGIPFDMTFAGIHAAGAISYEFYSSSKDQVTRAVMFNFDLYLPPDFEPKPVDGEMTEFILWDIQQLKESMDPDYPDPIKPNCYVVIIDYLLRTGKLSPEAPGYLDVLIGLRRGECR
jgi:8-oxo-dGTP pyrophosphatase MutT (NUDIX family)